MAFHSEKNGLRSNAALQDFTERSAPRALDVRCFATKFRAHSRASHDPARDRMAAILTAVVIQGCALALALQLPASEGWPPPFRQRNAIEGEGRIRIELVARPAAAKAVVTPARRLPLDTTRRQVTIKTPPVASQPLPPNTPVATVDAIPEQVATTAPNEVIERPPGSKNGGRPAASLPASAGAHDLEAPASRVDSGYLLAVHAAILNQWRSLGGIDSPPGCLIVLDQINDDKTAKATRILLTHCDDLPERERARLEQAAMQAQLPYAGYEPLFQRHLEIAFDPSARF